MLAAPSSFRSGPSVHDTNLNADALAQGHQATRGSVQHPVERSSYRVAHLRRRLQPRAKVGLFRLGVQRRSRFIVSDCDGYEAFQIGHLEHLGDKHPGDRPRGDAHGDRAAQVVDSADPAYQYRDSGGVYKADLLEIDDYGFGRPDTAKSLSQAGRFPGIKGAAEEYYSRSNRTLQVRPISPFVFEPVGTTETR
jgi:hypothetical protein